MRRNFHESRMELDPEGLARQDRPAPAAESVLAPQSRGGPFSGFRPFRVLLAASAVFIIFLMMFCLYFPAGGDEDANGAISGIYDNLARMNEEIESLTADFHGSKGELEDRLDGMAIELAGLSRKLDALAMRSGNAASDARVHTVKAGENVFSIARHYRMPVGTLCARNGITESEIIHPGQRLTLP